MSRTAKPTSSTAALIANNGQPCRFCHKPFTATHAQIVKLVTDMLGEYDGMTDQQVADDMEICPKCAGGK